MSRLRDDGCGAFHGSQLRRAARGESIAPGTHHRPWAGAPPAALAIRGVPEWLDDEGIETALIERVQNLRTRRCCSSARPERLVAGPLNAPPTPAYFTRMSLLTDLTPLTRRVTATALSTAACELTNPLN